jgi:hypothetical protein
VPLLSPLPLEARGTAVRVPWLSPLAVTSPRHCHAGAVAVALAVRSPWHCRGASLLSPLLSLGIRTNVRPSPLAVVRVASRE